MSASGGAGDVTSAVESKGKSSSQGDSELALRKLAERWGAAVRASHAYRGDVTAEIEKQSIVEVCRFLRDDPELCFEFLMDLTVVDWLGSRRERFDVVYHLYSVKYGRRLRLKVRLDGDAPMIDSVTAVWPGANWHEREAYDMYGVKFNNHPDLRRILLYPEFEGFPLRKDYPKEKVQPLVRRADLEKESEGGRKRA